MGDASDRLRWSRLHGLSQDEERGGVVNRGAREKQRNKVSLSANG